MEENFGNVMANLVRIGTVTSVDAARKKARVVFKDKSNLLSGWLSVLQHSGAGTSIMPDGEHAHAIRDTYTGGGSASTEPNHDHDGSTVTIWMPKIEDTVIVLYLPTSNADGFILGAM